MSTGASVSTLKWMISDPGLSGLVDPTSHRGLFSKALGITMPNPSSDKQSSASSLSASGADGRNQELILQRTAPASEAVEVDEARRTPPALQAERGQAELSSAEQDRLDAQAALGGDQAAFADLVSRYQSAVYNMAYRMLGDPTEAEDAAQEVFVRAWNQLHTFQQDRRFSTWLLSIASHLCIDLLRRRRPSAPLDDVALYVPSDEPQPEELAMRAEQRDMVKNLLNTLPDKYRSVTVLRYYNDLSYDEIARMTGLTESAVKTQLHRARRMLAEQLMEAGSR